MVGCLVEKEATVPDAYPLTLNSLRSACNQTSSRDPVVSFDDLTVQRCLDSLKASGYVRFVHPSHGERATKFRHVADEKLGLDRAQLAVLSVLALRGPQTSGELRTRTDRQHPFGSVGEVDEVLAGLAARDEPLTVELPRLPGHHQTRWAHLLAGPVDLDALAAVAGPGAAPTRVRTAGGGGGGFGAGADGRIAELEATVARLAARLARLEHELGLEVEVEVEDEDDAGAGAEPAGTEPSGDDRPTVIESTFGRGDPDRLDD